MIPSLALIVALYASARLLVLPFQVQGRRARIYATAVSALVLVGIVIQTVLILFSATANQAQRNALENFMR